MQNAKPFIEGQNVIQSYIITHFTPEPDLVPLKFISSQTTTRTHLPPLPSHRVLRVFSAIVISSSSSASSPPPISAVSSSALLLLHAAASPTPSVAQGCR